MDVPHAAQSSRDTLLTEGGDGWRKQRAGKAPQKTLKQACTSHQHLVSSKKHGSCLKLALTTQYTSYGDKDSLETS